jgi:hypothetical protein
MSLLNASFAMVVLSHQLSVDAAIDVAGEPLGRLLRGSGRAGTGDFENADKTSNGDWLKVLDSSGLLSASLVGVAVLEMGWLLNEVNQFRVTGMKSYLLDGFNWLNLIASSALLLSVLSPQFLSQPADVVRTVGAIGAACKWIGLLDYFRCFRTTGPPVRMVHSCCPTYLYTPPCPPPGPHIISPERALDTRVRLTTGSWRVADF